MSAVQTNFGESLRRARECHNLSQAELARKTGLNRGTIHNIEEGKTNPAAGTKRRLEEVVGLAVHELPATLPLTPAQWMMSPRYDPMQMCLDQVLALNGPGGTLEQTFAYLDPQSAADWYELANSPAYQQNFRSKIPIQEMAHSVAGSVKAGGLDVIGLGVGDGKTETRLAEALAALVPPGSLRTYLLDISHPLLVTAFKHALSVLPSEVAVFPIQGNFFDLGRILPLHPDAGRDRRRLWTMFGGTFGNLAHEPSFLRDMGACSRSGDFLLISVDVGYAASKDLDAVRREDPALNRELPETWHRWLKGPFHRHCRGVRDVKIELQVTNRCPLEGSYEVTCTARVLRASESRLFDVFRVRRYDLALLGHELADLGWVPRSSRKFGPAPEHTGLILLERR